jgi:hypothetical protein
MGMDVYGRNPAAKQGEYFRNSVWSWRPLADLCNALAPQVCADCKHWQSNDGDGLDDAGAQALAEVLERRLADGTIAKYIAERERYLANLPDEPCSLCNASGVRSDEVGVAHGMTTKRIADKGHPRNGQVGWCNGCDGRGSVRPFETHYPCEIENVAEFAAFLKCCGGFNIH